MENKEKNKPIVLIVLMILIVIAILVAIVLCFLMKKENIKNNENISTNNKQEETNVEYEENNDNIEVVPTMEDEIKNDTAWCPTFQLVWNDMKNEVVKKDIEFIDGDEPDYLDNLNNESYKEDDISEGLYFKTWGEKSNELKEDILNGIKEKFNEDSSIIDRDENWDESKSPDIINYIFYTMLKRNFNFFTEFDILEKGNFGDKYKNVQYFGIDKNSKEEIRNQVKVLYYNSDDDFAISIFTQENDNVIFVKNPKDKDFKTIYENLLKESEKFDGDISIQSIDEVKIPNLKFNLKKEYEELIGKTFYNSESKECKIEKAIQSIELELDNKGGKIKSEAEIEQELATAYVQPGELESRKFYLDDNFVMFVKEGEKDLPYFALNVNDISKYQDDVEAE